MAGCANPDCTRDNVSNSRYWANWVQIQETTLIELDVHGSKTVQTNFAAVTCSKRCAVAVLSQQLEVEDARAEARSYFASGQPEPSQ